MMLIDIFFEGTKVYGFDDITKLKRRKKFKNRAFLSV